MKKIILSLAIVFGLGIAQISAQGVSFGIKAEANMSSFILSDFGIVESKIGIGGTFGGFSTISVTENFAIQPELLFHFRSSGWEEDLGIGAYGVQRIQDNIHYWGMEIPVYALGQWNTVCGSRFFAGVGPYAGFGFSAKLNTADTDLYEQFEGYSMLRRFDFGFGTLFGIEFPNRVQINASYRIGVLNMLDYGRADARALPHTFSLGIGYRF